MVCFMQAGGQENILEILGWTVYINGALELNIVLTKKKFIARCFLNDSPQMHVV